MVAQRPHGLHLHVITPTQPEADAVASDGAERGPQQGRPERQGVGADHRTDAEHHRRSGEEQADQRQGLEEGDEEYPDTGPSRVGAYPAKEGRDRIHVIILQPVFFRSLFYCIWGCGDYSYCKSRQ